MVDSLMSLFGITGRLSNDVVFAISAGMVLVVFSLLLVGLGAVFGRWFR